MIHKRHFLKLFTSIILIVTVSLSVGACKSSNSTVAQTVAPSITVDMSPGGNCTAVGSNYSCTGLTTTISLTASSTTASIVYGSLLGAAPALGDMQVTGSTARVTVTATAASTYYFTYYGRDSAGVDGTSTTITFSFIGTTTTTTTTPTTTTTTTTTPATTTTTTTTTIADTTAPVSSITVSGTGVTCTTASSTASCDGAVTLSISANETSTVFYTTAVGSTPATPTTSSTSSSAPLSLAVTANDYRISYLVQDTAGNQEAVQSFIVNISGITTSINSGYYKVNQSLTLGLNSVRSLSKFQLYYLKNADPTAAIGAVMSSVPAPHASAVRYLDYYTSGCYDSFSEAIGLDSSSGTTTIHQLTYNLLSGGTYVPGSCGVTGGSVDNAQSMVVYVDLDTPRVNLIPAGGGSMSSTLTVKAMIHDAGFQTITSANSTNSALSTSTPILDASATYCTPSVTPTDPTASTFWSSCIAAWIGIANDATFSVTSDKYYSAKAQDAASNRNSCIAAQANCAQTPTGGDGDAMYYQFTPGKMEMSYYAADSFYNSSERYHFGHSIAVGDLDNDGYANDYAIGAPALVPDAASGNNNNGAVYVYYNGFRERATKSFTLGAATVDLSAYTLTFSADGNSSFQVNFSGTGTPATGQYNALTGDITTITAATATEMAKVLNRAFLSTVGGLYTLELYAEASADSSGNGIVSISHNKRNQTSYFSVTASAALGGTTGFTTTAQTVRPYDYVYYGEANGDEFGYSVAIAKVDSGTGTNSGQSLIVGAPGASSNQGAAYILSLPATATAAASSQVTLATALATNGLRLSGDSASSGRFGHALGTYSISSTANPDLFITAPYLSGAGTNRGAVYQFTTADFTYSATAVSATTGAADSYVGAVDQALLGFSMVIGKAHDYKTAPVIYAGAPGNGIEGKVYYLFLDTTVAASITTTSASPAPAYSAPLISGATATNNKFGYSVTISDGNFDTLSTATCPCLVVGSPGASGGTYGTSSFASQGGAVWVNESFAFPGGTDEGIGTQVYSAQLGFSDFKQTLFVSGIGSNTSTHSGKVYVIAPQALSSSTALTASTAISTGSNGGNFGQSLAVVEYSAELDSNSNLTGNSYKALVVGSPGEANSISAANDPYYSEATLNKRNRSQRGTVQIYSSTRLGY